MEFEEIDLRELFDIIKKRLVLIVIIMVVTVATVGILSYFVLDKEYEASTSLIVGNSDSSDVSTQLQYNDLMMYQKLLKTFSEIAKSEMVSEKVISSMKLNYSVGSLQKRISVTPVGDTQMINIKVQDNNPEMAAAIANELARIFKYEVGSIMKVDNIEVIDAAKVPLSPIKPRPTLNIAIAFMLSLMVGVGTSFLLEYMDHTVKSPSDVEKYLGLPVIGAIPDTTHIN